MNRLKLIFAIVLLAAVPALAQVQTPYSMYGYGILGDRATSMQRQMGGVGYAMNSGRQINVMNPASYAAIDSLTFLFDMGADLSLIWSEEGSAKEHATGGGLDYITMQFPICKFMGGSVGLLPYSSVGYAFGNDIAHGTMENQGSGGINQLYLGAGITPVKGLRLGVNISYLFGNICNDVLATSSNGISAVFEQMMEIQDYHLRFGAQYTCNISHKHSVTAGVTFEPGKSLLGDTYVVKYLQNSSAAPDTIAPGVVSLKNNFSLPSSWGFGVAYDFNNRLHAELDFTYQPWKKAKYAQIENFSATRIDDRWKVAVGASYQPDPRGSYFKRMSYRAGAFYNRDYIMVGDNHVRDYGISCGVGFPAHSSKTIINLGFEYKQRQATPNPLLKENYFNLTLGVNFNGTWFYRNKLK